MNFFKSSPFFLAILLIINISCTDQNDELTEAKSLQGLWVDIQTGTDTLVFDYWGDGDEVMYLNRARELRDGHLLPKSKAGSYDYELLKNEISLRWHLSSNSAFNQFSFEKNGDQLVIGNFYDDTAFGTKMTFKKID
ncbi:hypothetical protein [Chondrinema litorale]|uniref:hypothetical protein n=1 Tax=Chondrinema litorale TaxID=2994555 RepID=UPI0025430DB4|nr:hypothetical protein [Chondrinema litorale]UZR95222.1 hypothetical protein OQ292_05240 [Chondrinema litorale]